MAFTHRVDITTDSAVIDAALSNPLAIIDLRQAPAAFWTHLQRADAGDIQVFDSSGDIRFPLYAMFIDTINQRGALAARVDSFPDGEGKTFRIKIGDTDQTAPAVDAANGRNEVFQDWKLALNGMKVAGSAPEIEDMTGNGYDGTIVGGFAIADGAGRFGRAIQNSLAASGISINDPSDEFREDEMGILTVSTKESAGNTGGSLIGWTGNTELRRNNSRYQARISGDNLWRLFDAIPEDVAQVYGFNFDLPSTFSGSWVNGVADDSSSSYTGGFPGSATLTWLGKANKSDAVIGTGSLLLWRTGAGAELSSAEQRVYAAMINDADTPFWTWGAVVSLDAPIPATDERTFTPAAQDRTFTPASQDRTFTAPRQNRTYTPEI